MRHTLLAAGTALLLCQTAAMAQTATTPNNQTTPNHQMTPPAVAPSSNAAASNNNSPSELRDHIRQMLAQAGFNDIRVLPSSFMVHAKDQNGNPVIMSVSPDSVTEVAEVGGSTSAAGSTSSSKTASTEQGSPFVNVNDNDKLSSNVVGLDVYGSGNQNIGQIKDVAFGPQGHTQAYIVSVGGVLGVGQRYVAVNPADIQVSYNNSDKKWHATIATSADQLKSAPQFKYNGQWDASKS